MVAEQRDDSGRADGFDPRFDPAFQRGYQPQPGERARTRVRADAPDSAYRRPSSLLRTREDSAPATPSEPLTPYEEAALSLDERPLAAATPADSGAVGPQTVVVASPGVFSRVELNPRRNPFILALWIIGGGFVVLGILLYSVSVTSSYNGPTPSTDVAALVFAQLGWMLAGPLIMVGLLTIVGLLFLTALSGRRSRGAEPEGDVADE